MPSAGRPPHHKCPAVPMSASRGMIAHLNSDIAGSRWSDEVRHLKTHQSAEVAYRANVIQLSCKNSLSPRVRPDTGGQMMQAMERSDGRAPCLWQREVGSSKRRIEQEKPALGPCDTSGDIPTSGGKERGGTTGRFWLLFCGLRRLATHDVSASQRRPSGPRRALR